MWWAAFIKDWVKSYLSVTAPFRLIKRRLALHDFYAIARYAYSRSLAQCRDHSLGFAIHWKVYYAHLRRDLLREYLRRGFISVWQWLVFEVFNCGCSIVEAVMYWLDFRARFYTLYLSENVASRLLSGKTKPILTCTLGNPNLSHYPERLDRRRFICDVGFCSSPGKVVCKKQQTDAGIRWQVLRLKWRFPMLPCSFIEETLMQVQLVNAFIARVEPSLVLLEESLDSRQAAVSVAASLRGIPTLITYRNPFPYLPHYCFGNLVATADRLAQQSMQTVNAEVILLRDQYSFPWRQFISNRSRPVDAGDLIVGYGPDLGNFGLNRDSKMKFDCGVLEALERKGVVCRIKCHPQEHFSTCARVYYEQLQKRYPCLQIIDMETPIHDFLRDVDIWISFSSTTIVQAALCRIPVAIVNFDGDRAYEDLVRASGGLIRYAETSEHLLVLIDELHSLLNDPQKLKACWQAMVDNLAIDPDHDQVDSFLDLLASLERPRYC